jgi:GNAT superfamily N-acetyltransferase
MKIFKLILSSIFILSITAGNASESPFRSNIFTYDDPLNAQNLHVSLKGDNWRAEDIKLTHLDFHISLFGNPTVMAGFADGQVRDAESVTNRVKNSVEERFVKGQPHGLLTVFDHSEQPFMHIVAGGGDRPGTSEIAYAMMPNYWNKGYGGKVLAKIVQEWAPEVYKIGRGDGLDSIPNENIVKAFQCFGGKPLDQLDATASPSNIASWKILVKLGFEAAKCDLGATDTVIDYDHKEFESSNAMESDLLSHFAPTSITTDVEQLMPGKRYRMIDPEGNVRTFSKHARWERMKYHFEYNRFAQ